MENPNSGAAFRHLRDLADAALAEKDAENAALLHRLARARERERALGAIIEEAQWRGKRLFQGMAGWDWCCPLCERNEKDGHSRDCPIALATPTDGAAWAGDAAGDGGETHG